MDSIDLGKMRLNQILKDESVYQAALNERIETFEAYKKRFRTERFKRKINRLIRKTRESHQLALALKTATTQLEGKLVDEAAVLDHLSGSLAAKFQKGLRGMIPAEMHKEMIAQLRSELLTAKQFILETRAGSQNNGLSFGEILNRELPDDGSAERRSLRSTIHDLAMLLEAYRETRSVCLLMIELAQLFRGMLYMGIIDVVGDYFDNAEFMNGLKSFGLEGLGKALGDMPGILKTIQEMYSGLQVLQRNKLPDLLEKAEEAEEFFDVYLGYLLRWEDTAVRLMAQMNHIRQAVLLQAGA